MLGIFAPTPKIVNSKMERALLMSARGTKSHNEKKAADSMVSGPVWAKNRSEMKGVSRSPVEPSCQAIRVLTLTNVSPSTIYQSPATNP
jgi:hypothetical protein